MRGVSDVSDADDLDLQGVGNTGGEDKGLEANHEDHSGDVNKAHTNSWVLTTDRLYGPKTQICEKETKILAAP